MDEGIFIEKELIQSAAFNNLSGFAPQLLIHFLNKQTFEQIGINEFKGVDNIKLTYHEIQQKYGITQPKITRAIDKLLAFGFLSVTKPGGKFEGNAAGYNLIDKWMKWKTGIVFETRQSPTNKKGFCKNTQKNNFKNGKLPIKTGYIYVIKSQDNYKIGVTNNIKTRTKKYITESPHKIKVIISAKANDYLNKERFLHNYFKESRIRGEWFSLTEQDIQTITAYIS